MSPPRWQVPRTLFALPPVGGLVPPSGSKCHLQSQALHPDTQQPFSGVTCPNVSLGVFTQAQEDAGPGNQLAGAVAGQQEARAARTPRLAGLAPVLLGPPLVELRLGCLGGVAGPCPAWSMADSHLVAGQRMLRGLQVRAGFTHEDVPLAGDGPDGLWGGPAKDPPALTAGQVKQGQLARADSQSPLGGRAAGQGGAALRLLPLDPWPVGDTAHSPSHSCPARWRQPGAPATSAGSFRGCTGQRRAWPH